ncbi:uncharacterized protein KGF55_002163 [Candida pseudojiufengensis]|uniref:uncharacterized protein n=1 Tax=Candida pseudojiufengensis TaxID=497109 RepID=UPI0022259BAF|nr:uncharacterized protein KGF55_002163 [Candida pseudojiufengensis]KAI5964221.1 hypothetical protein KGF55_002163 [Candida pseudojiufengensis]
MQIDLICPLRTERSSLNFKELRTYFELNGALKFLLDIVIGTQIPISSSAAYPILQSNDLDLKTLILNMSKGDLIQNLHDTASGPVPKTPSCMSIETAQILLINDDINTNDNVEWD